MSWFDQTEEQRLTRQCPRFIGRPPAPERPPADAPRDDQRAYEDALYRWGQDWTTWREPPHGGFAHLLTKGWEVRRIYPPSRAMSSAAKDVPWEERHEQKLRAYRDRVNAWADAFIADTGEMPFYPEDREAMLTEVARRLREATADGFLLRALTVAQGETHGTAAFDEQREGPDA